jgi:tetratricopeptide (TPR) repeat protein
LHVDTCAACARLFSEAAAARATADGYARTAPDHLVATHPDDRPGVARAGPLQLGRYHIERMLGMGGMGVVYACWDPELDRKVAIKLLQPQSRISPATLRLRLQREAQAMARLSHPNVVHVHEIGTYGDQVFVVMEFVDGTTLNAWLRDHERPWREILEAFLHAGAGLEAAHHAGMVHRDFKPDNVLVGRRGQIRVSDFGLAGRLEEGGEAPDTRDLSVTYSGQIVGTPAYMAPEQMRGETTDARTDVFSFSVALYEALFGVRPFAGKNLEELRAAIEAEKLEPPVRAGVPRWLERAVLRGIHAAPGDRWPSMSALLAALRADPTRRRRRWLIAGVSLALCLSAVGIGWRQARRHSLLCKGAERKLAGIWDGPRKTAIREAMLKTGSAAAPSVFGGVERAVDEYLATWARQHEAACEATRLRGEQSETVLDQRMQCLADRLDAVRALGEVLAAADAATVDHAVTAAHALPSVAECANLDAVRASALPADPALRAQVSRLKQELATAMTLSSTGHDREALDRASRVAADPAAQAFLPLLAEAEMARGTSLEYLSDVDEAQRVLHEAANLALKSKNDGAAVRAWLSLANLTGDRLEHLDEGLRWDEMAEALIQRLGAPADLEQRRLYTLGSIYASNDKHDELEATARRAVALAESSQPPDDLTLARALDLLAGAQADKGQLAESVATQTRALDLLTRAGAGDTSSTAGQLYNAALTYGLLNRYDEAERLLRRALALDERLLPPDHPHILGALVELAQALVKLRRLDEAAAVLEKARPMAMKRRRELARALPQILYWQGEIEMAHGHREKAVELWKTALADPGITANDRKEVEHALAR